LAAEVHDLTGAESRRFEVDVVCLGQGFEPSNELLRALGAAHDFDERAGHLVARRDDSCRTTLPTVYALGDCTGLGGARAALAEGTIAGLSAADSLGHLLSADLRRDLRSARRDLARHRRFQAALWRLFAAPRPSLEAVAADTILCRCEEVTAGTIHAALDEGYRSVGNVKRRTRAGMGRCQGRYCGPLLNRLVAERCGTPLDEFSGFAPRVPVKPVTIADLASGAEL
jgi:NAD(P)H-nitrite reductase large subunit